MQDLADQVITSILSLTAPAPLSDNEFTTIADIVKALLMRGEVNEEEPCDRVAEAIAREAGMAVEVRRDKIIRPTRTSATLSKGTITLNCTSALRNTAILMYKRHPHIPLLGLILKLRGLGILRITNANRYAVTLSTEEVNKLFEEVKAKVRGRALISIHGDEYLFIRRGDSLIRIERLGEGVVSVVKGDYQYKYALVPKDSLNDLILKVKLMCFETEPKCSLSMWWIEPGWFLEPYINRFQSENALPDELAQYNVEPIDRVSIPPNVLNSLSNEYKSIVNKLRNLFVVGSQGGEVDAESVEHRLVKERLVEVGRRVGFEAVQEFSVGDFRLDVAWLDGDEIAYAFEVVISGSLLEALYRLEHVSAGKRILVVRDEELKRAMERAGGGIKVIPTSLILNGKTHEIIREVIT